jgi:antitoxin ParD1/3/4
MAARNVNLTDRLGDFVDRQVESGRHQNASEVVREALRRYQFDLEAEEAALEAIRTIAREGREAIGRGEFLLIDGEQARADLFRRLSGRKAPWAEARDGGGGSAPDGDLAPRG